jgi:acetyl esterase/lipase
VAVDAYPEELARLTTTAGGDLVVERYGEAAEQMGEMWPVRPARPARSPTGPDGPHPVAVLVHGGYWRRRYRLDLMHALAADLQRRGVAVWNLEYRRVGSAGGGWPGTFDDVAAGFDALRDLAGRHHLDLRSVAVVGHSAGGHLALWLAGRARLDSGPGARPRLLPALAVALAGVCDLVEAARRHLSQNAVVDLLGGGPQERPEAYLRGSPAALLPLGVPQLLVHGTADESVPFDISERYAAAARDAGDTCELIALEGVDHFALIDPASSAWQRTAERLSQALRPHAGGGRGDSAIRGMEPGGPA